MDKKSSSFKPDADLLKGATFHDNISQTYIRITEDKLRNYLNKFRQGAIIRFSWIAPVTLIISLYSILQTTTFSEQFGKTPEFWESLFTFFLVGSIIWFGISLIRVITNWKESNTENLIKRIKNDI